MANPYGIVLFYPGKPEAADLSLLHVAPFPARFLAGLVDSRAAADVAATSSAVFTIKKNGSTVATVTFAAGSKLGVFAAASNFSLQASDLIAIYAPSSQDATLSDVSITLMGERLERASLFALLTASASFTATLDHTYLYATMTARASLASRLREANAFGPQLLIGNAGLLGTLSDCKTLKCNMRLGKAPEFFGRLTVVKDERIFR